MRNLFKNFDMETALMFAFAMSGAALAVVGGIMALVFGSFWPLLLWLPAIVCGAVFAGWI